MNQKLYLSNDIVEHESILHISLFLYFSVPFLDDAILFLCSEDNVVYYSVILFYVFSQ
jgi:hypothetical protein